MQWIKFRHKTMTVINPNKRDFAHVGANKIMQFFLRLGWQCADTLFHSSRFKIKQAFRVREGLYILWPVYFINCICLAAIEIPYTEISGSALQTVYH